MHFLTVVSVLFLCLLQQSGYGLFSLWGAGGIIGYNIETMLQHKNSKLSKPVDMSSNHISLRGQMDPSSIASDQQQTDMEGI